MIDLNAHTERFSLLHGFVVVTGFFNGHKLHRIMRDREVIASFNANSFEFEIVGTLAQFKPKGWRGSF
jgi:hypothetical protein